MTSLRTTTPLVESAVLAPVFRDAQGEMHLLLVVRGPRGIHGGQIAFPGGRREPEDASLLETALRESEEEIGLSRDDVEVVTPLPVVETLATGFRIAPYLGRLKAPRNGLWQPQESEIAEVLEIPVSYLADPANHGEELWQLDHWPGPQPVPFYRIGPHKLWGATYRIVQPLLGRLLSREWPL